MTSPEDVHAHGRAWAYEELMIKGWDDLQTIWWTCLRERNWLATEKAELKRRDAGVGMGEIEERDKTVSNLFFLVIGILGAGYCSSDETSPFTRRYDSGLSGMLNLAWS